MEFDDDEQKKIVNPFILRGAEVQKMDAKVSYYCRLYAVDVALHHFPQPGPKLKATVVQLLKLLETMKPSLTLDSDQDYYHCEAFALKVFARADKADRAGQAGSGTAKAYLASCYFLETLKQFKEGKADPDAGIDSDLPGHLEEKKKYALWKAADIQKAIREGRKPTPGGPDDWASGEDALGAAPSVPAEHQPEAASSSQAEPPQAQELPSVPTSSEPPSVPTTYGAKAYQNGQNVVYKANPSSAPVQGVISSVEQGLYQVLLSDGLVGATAAQIAPLLAQGSQVIYFHGQATATATVASTDISKWPPNYILTLPSGQTVSASIHDVAVPDSVAVQGGTSIPSEDVTAPVKQGGGFLGAMFGGGQKQAQASQVQSAGKLDLKAKEDAIKQTRYAISALNFDDAHGAIEYLEKALDILRKQ